MYDLRVESASNNSNRFLHGLAVSGNKSESAAVVDIQVRKIERQQVQRFSVDDDQLIVIANQVVRGAGNGNAGFQKAHFESPQMFLAAAIDVGDEGGHFHPALGRGFQLHLYIGSVKAKNGDLHRFFGFLDRR